MDVTIIEAQSRLRELLEAVEAGEQVIITKDDKPVAQLTKAPPDYVPEPKKRRKVRFGTMKDRIKLLPGWDDPIDLDSFLKGDF